MRYIFMLSLFFYNTSIAQKKILEFNSEIHSLVKKPGIITLDLKKDFGASGNGKINYCDSNTSTADHKAFESAAEFINRRGGNIKLIVPYGNYVVGKQIFNGGKVNHYVKYGWEGEYAAIDGYDCMLLIKVKNVTIEGVLSKNGSKPVITYRKSLKYGLFSSVDGSAVPSNLVSKNNNLYSDKTQRQRAYIGNCFMLYRCSVISISNLSIDGNSNNFVLGGKYGKGSNPYEIPHNAFSILNSKIISIFKVDIKNLGLDGIIIKDSGSDSLHTVDNITISNCIVKANGRLGLAWLTGTNVKIINCEFSEMGTGRISTEPCAGIDIEGETIFDKNIPANGEFIKCTIKDNYWLGLAAGVASLNGKLIRSRNMKFRDCIFIGSKNMIADIESDGYKFDSCSFYGQLYLRNNSSNIEYATKFNNCSFSNFYQGKKMKGSFLIANASAKRTSFLNCRFTSYGERIFLMDNNGFECGEYKSYPVFENCFFKNYIDSLDDGWFKTSGLGSKTAYKNNSFYFNAAYPFINDTYSGNMCAQDLGGNKYIVLSKKEISLALLKPQ